MFARLLLDSFIHLSKQLSFNLAKFFTVKNAVGKFLSLYDDSFLSVDDSKTSIVHGVKK